MKYNGPKAKRVRRHGVNLYGPDKYDKILQRKPNAPGKSPRARLGRLSEYATQLKEKQKMRDMFNLSEAQFRRTFAAASRAVGQTGERFKQLLETRLDNAVYRAGFANTRMQSRQFVSHGLFMVNGTRVTIPSFQVKIGDVIAVRVRSKTSPVFGPILAAHEKYMPPSWMKVDSGAMTSEVVTLPAPEDCEQAVDVRQIVEFYSRN